MSLFALVMALLLEQVRPAGLGHAPARALRAWVHAVGRAVDAGGVRHGWLAWALAVAAPALLVALVHALLLWLGGWALALPWSVAVLYFTLGLRLSGQRLLGVRAALEAGDDALARQRLAQWHKADAASLRGLCLAADAGSPHGFPAAADAPATQSASHLADEALPRRALECAVLCAHRRVLGVLAWHAPLAALGLGPAGAVLYRMADFAAGYWQGQSRQSDTPVSAALCRAAATAWQALDWWAARATALAFAVMGRFEDAVEQWRQAAKAAPPASAGMGSAQAVPGEAIVLATAAGALGVALGVALGAAQAVRGGAAAGMAAYVAGDTPAEAATHAAGAAAPDAAATARAGAAAGRGGDAAHAAHAASAPAHAAPWLTAGEAVRTAHFDAFASLLWRSLVLWLLLWVLAAFSHLL